MNSFLERFAITVEMETAEGIQTVRAALLCVSCDIPAARKLVVTLH